jgi:translation elongation factor EF-4
MEIIRERLQREYNLDLISTAPTVIYKVMTTKGESLTIDNPANLPDPSNIEYLEEPYIQATIIAPGTLYRKYSSTLPGTSRHSKKHAVPRPNSHNADL